MIYQHKTATKQATADNIRKPMHARNKSADYHKSNKTCNQTVQELSESLAFNAFRKLHDGSWHNTQYE